MEGLKIQWPREKGRAENTTFFSWPLHFQSFLFLLAIVFSVLPFSLGHCIFSPSFFSWPLYFQSFHFLLAIVFSVLPFSLGHCIFSPSFFSWPLHFQSQWPREKGRTEHTMAKRKRKD
jgi:hypothetical protein